MDDNVRWKATIKHGDVRVTKYFEHPPCPGTGEDAIAVIHNNGVVVTDAQVRH